MADVAKIIDLYHDSQQPIVMINGFPTTVDIATDNSMEDAEAATPAIPESLDDKSLGAPMKQHGVEPSDGRKQPLGRKLH